MKYLLDTQLLLWAAGADPAMPAEAAAIIDDPLNDLMFSAASIWEVAVKAGSGRADFRVDPRVLRRGLLDNGYIELPIGSDHAAAVIGLASLHNDPFDRMLLAQAMTEGVTLLTADARLALYPGPVRLTRR